MAEILKADLCIIGAGALGRMLAIDARARGLNVILVQRPTELAGQTTSAAVQRAAFLASANHAHAAASAAALGLAKAAPKPGFRAIGERAAALAEAAAPAAAPTHLVAQGITMLTGPAEFADSRTLRLGDSLIRAGQFVLATGSTPRLPDLPGLDQVPFFTPDTILDNLRKLSHLLVIGGDAAAFELAQAYARLGAMVTLVSQGPVLPGFDPEPVAVLLRALREEGVDILEGGQVTAVLPRSQGTGIALAHADGSLATLDVSHILVAAGRVPDLDPAVLAALRLRRDRQRPDHLQVTPEGQTSSARITAIGGAAGVFDAPHALRQAAHVLARASGAAPGRIDLQRLPRLVNTRPALAQLGGAGALLPVRPGQLLLRASASETDAARATGRLIGGASLLVAANGTVLGTTILGDGAAELAAMLALAIDRDLGAADLADLLLPPASLAALLVDLGWQYRALHPPSAWARRWAVLRRLLP